MLIWKIAWRNVWRHKGKSLVIGAIIFLGAMLMTVGNAVTKGAKQGLEEYLANRMTGQLTLVPKDLDTRSIFFTEGILPLKVLPEYPKVKQILENQDFIEGFVPMSRGYAMILNEGGVAQQDEEVGEGASFLFGVEFEEYQRLFQNLVAVEGSLLQKGERGVLITEKDRKKIYNRHNIWVVPKGNPVIEDAMPPEIRANKEQVIIKDELVFLGLSGESLEADIRIPVKGIVRFRGLNRVWMGSFVDIESFRQCFGYLTSSEITRELSADRAALFAMEDEGDLFAEDKLVERRDTEEAGHYDVAAMQQQTERTVREIKTDKGAYQFVAIKLKPDIPLQEGEIRLRRMLEEEQADVKVLTWKESTGSVAQFAALTQGALFVFVLFIFFVAAIVITNTLSMAVLERTSEIGMMRAIGARKKFIGKMLLAEIVLLAATFGGLGMIIGVIVVWGLVAMHVPTTSHEMISLLVGGDVLHPIVDSLGFVFGSGQLAVVAVLAALYPMVVAQKITPLDAISRE